jgi:transcriptional regulator GlxA family with amidase domain
MSQCASKIQGLQCLLQAGHADKHDTGFAPITEEVIRHIQAGSHNLIVMELSPAQLRLYRRALDRLFRSELARVKRLRKVRSKRLARAEEQLEEIRAEFSRVARRELGGTV